MSRPRVAIAHDYVTQRGGAERVVLAMLRTFPDATLYTTLYEPDATYPEFREHRIVTSPLNRIPAFRRNHRTALPLMAWAASRVHVDADVVVASSTGWAHGFDITGRTLVYCNTPARWLYQPQTYVGGPLWASPKGWMLGTLRRPLTRWDAAAAARADRYLANSRVVRARIALEYGRQSEVLHPPFTIDTSGPEEPIPGASAWGREGFLLLVSRLLPYKNVDVVIEAVRGSTDRLIVIGAGPEHDRLMRGLPDNVRMFDNLPDAQMRWAYRHALALIAPSYEDFGLTPLEAGGYGKPTVALRSGGYLDTVEEGLNGLFFDHPTTAEVHAAVTAVAHRSWDGKAIRRHIDRFSEEHFADRLRHEVATLLETVR